MKDDRVLSDSEAADLFRMQLEEVEEKIAAMEFARDLQRQVETIGQLPPKDQIKFTQRYLKATRRKISFDEAVEFCIAYAKAYGVSEGKAREELWDWLGMMLSDDGREKFAQYDALRR